MVNFRVVENYSESDEYWSDYDEFVRLYNHSNMSIETIKYSLDLSLAKYNRYRKKALAEGCIPDKRSIKIKYNKSLSWKMYAYNKIMAYLSICGIELEHDKVEGIVNNVLKDYPDESVYSLCEKARRLVELEVNYGF